MKNKNELMQRMERFVAETLLEKLGHRQKQFSLEATDLGIHNQVYFLTIGGGPPLVLKGITSKERFRALMQCTEHLLQKDVRVPQILYAHEDQRLFQWSRLHVICEERIMGRTIFDMQQPETLIPEIARFFSCMHRIQRNAWGKISEPQQDGLYQYLAAKARAKLKQWQQRDTLCDSSFARHCLGWMKARQATVQNISSFSLSHCDPNPGNIMLSQEGEMVLLDVGHLRYLPRALDYYHLLVHFCQDRQELIKLFEEHYFADVPREEREAFTASHLFFKLSVFIYFGQNLATRLATVERNHPWHQEFITNLGKIRQAIEEIVER